MTSYCIFQEPWWLDAVAPGAWTSLEVSRGTQLTARMPIVVRRKYGFRIIRQPPLTPTLGPWFRSPATNTVREMAEQKKTINELIDQLPNWDYFEVNLHPCVTNWLPFYWRGFEQTTLYTYVLPDTSKLGALWAGMQENVRRHIRKAEKTLSIRTDLSVGQLLDVVALTFSRQGRRLPFKRELFCRIDDACRARDARRMYFAEDASGAIHAALYIVTDREYAYYLIGGADPQLRSSGAQSLLFWQAIKDASEENLKFDFEGSMIEPIERVFRAFGTVQVPYLRVYQARPLVKALIQVCPRSLMAGAARNL